MSFVIRPIAPGDRAGWEALWQGYLAFSQETVPPEMTELTWSRFFDGAAPLHALVAEEAGGLVGLAHYIFHLTTRLAGPACYMQDLFVAETARGQGVGQALTEAVHAAARAAGSTRAYWMTREGNAAAQSLYDRIADRRGVVFYRKVL